MQNYISASLVNSWLYLTHSEYADFEDFKNTLMKVPFEPTEAMQKGIDFEKEVMDGLHEPYLKYTDGALSQVRILGECKGILISGIMDLVQYDWIYDIKYTKNYEIGKYFNSSQHILYCYITGIKKFKYLINKECYVEEYHYKEGSAEKLIEEFIDWLRAVNLYETWRKYWIK